MRDYLLEGGHRFDHMFVAMHAVREGLGSIVAPKKFFVGLSRWEAPLPVSRHGGEGRAVLCTFDLTSGPRHVNRFVSWLKEEIGK